MYRYNLFIFVLACILVMLLCSCISHPNTPVDIPVSTTAMTTETTQVTECTTAPIETTIIVTEPEETIPIETEPPVTEETVPDVDADEWEMLACVIYQEAGGDMHCDECRRRVADVVLNRMADSRFPDTMYEVLTQPNQYGRFSKTGIVWPSRSKYETEAEAVERAYRIAFEVLSGQHSELYGEGYIWQATFKQGRDNIYHCGHYFGR